MGTMKTSYSIGEFSQVTGLSVKTLRFYHERGILIPSSVDEATGYRFYDAAKVEKARVIMRLRQMEFSIEDIAAVLGECSDEADILNYLERQKNVLQQRIQEDRDIVRSFNEIIAKEKSARQILETGNFAVEEKTFAPLLIASIRMKGKYPDIGAGFARLGKAVGRHICGKPLCLYYDGEYREDDATSSRAFPSAGKSPWTASPCAPCRADAASRSCIAALTINWAAATRRFCNRRTSGNPPSPSRRAKFTSKARA